MRLAVASGKGGTGKTLVATSLARLWADDGLAVTYVDADVEAPNGHLLLHPQVEATTPFTVRVPTLAGETCAGHGACQAICAFNAILSVKGEVMVFDELCHGCGACVLACPDDALRERDRVIGVIERGHADGLTFVAGRLDVGEASMTPLTAGAVRAGSIDQDAARVVVIDAPPGTSCSAMAAVEEADLVLLVTEPTPFGLHDLRLAIDMNRALGRPMAAVINRSDLGDDRTQQLLSEQSIPLLAELPFDRQVAEAYAVGQLPSVTCPPFAKRVSALGAALLERLVGTAS